MNVAKENTMTKQIESPPVVRYTHSDKTHYVIASGGPGDGSLHGMYTYCSRQIDLEALPDGWVEQPGMEVTCGTCKRSEQAGRSYREATYYKNAYYNLLVVCEDLIRDADHRPGAYLHARIDRIRVLVNNS